MKEIDEYIQNEMDDIIVKTFSHVQPVLNEKGPEQAKELILLIAKGISKQLLESGMSVTDASKVHELFLLEINAVVFEKKH
jgi:hypothetical protein